MDVGDGDDDGKGDGVADVITVVRVSSEMNIVQIPCRPPVVGVMIVWCRLRETTNESAFFGSSW